MRDSGEQLSVQWLGVWVAVLCVGLVGVARFWPDYFSQSQPAFDLGLSGLVGAGAGAVAAAKQPLYGAAWVELVKLIGAGLVGIVVTMVHRRYHGDKPPNRSLMQAAVLLCVSGALMMIIIGNSTARALGIAGGASIIRFRTPVDDPKDTILLFLVLGLGMSLGLGAFAVCGLATMFLCVFLAFLDRFGEVKPRAMMLDLISASKDFPLEHVQDVLRSSVEFYEPVKTTQGNEAAMRFSVKVAASASLAWISDQLMAGGAGGLKSVSWEPAKKSAE